MPETLTIAAGLVYFALFAFFVFAWWRDRRKRLTGEAAAERDRAGGAAAMEAGEVQNAAVDGLNAGGKRRPF